MKLRSLIEAPLSLLSGVTAGARGAARHLLVALVAQSILLGAAGAAPIAPDDLFFAPSSIVAAKYPRETVTGNGANIPWQAVWTAADIAAVDPGRVDITITGAEILPILVPNPAVTSTEGEYTSADLAAITVSNYNTYYYRHPGTDLTNTATDYAADLTSNVLTAQFKFGSTYQVRVKTTSRSAPANPVEARNYIFTEYVNDFQADTGGGDAEGASRQFPTPDGDIYIVSKDPTDNGAMANGEANLKDQGKDVTEVSNIQELIDAILAACKKKGGPVCVVLLAHGNSGLVKVGNQYIAESGGDMTPTEFGKKVKGCVKCITLLSCLVGNDSTFCQDLANAADCPVTAWKKTVTMAAPSTWLVFWHVAGFFDVGTDAKKAEVDPVRANNAVMSSPTTLGNSVFWGANDGFLYGTTTTGTVLDNFPIDIHALSQVGVPVQVASRPAIYFGAGGTPNIYLTTNMGHVLSVSLEGTVNWVSRPDPTAQNVSSTPAVTDLGDLFVGISGANGARVWKLNSQTGNPVSVSPPLAPPFTGISAPAVANNRVYVGLSNGYVGDIAVLDYNLTVRSSGIASGEHVVAPPYVEGQSMYVGTLAGNFYKVSSVTTNPDPTFGTGGRAHIGEPLSTSPFATGPISLSSTNSLLVGTDLGHVMRVQGTGFFDVFFDPGVLTQHQPVQGVVVVPGVSDSTVAFGSGALFFQVPLHNPTLPYFTPDRGLPGGGFSTTPTFSALSNAFYEGNKDGYVYQVHRAIP